MILPNLVMVDWLDAGSDDQWLTRAELKEKLADENRTVITTVGYRVMDTERFVVIAMSINCHDDEDLSGNHIYIPKTMIVKEVELADL